MRDLERERSRLQAELADRARGERDGRGVGTAVGSLTGARLQLETEVMRLRASEARATAAATEWRSRLQALERELKKEEAQDSPRTVGEGRAAEREGESRGERGRAWVVRVD